MQFLEINKGDQVKWASYHHIGEFTSVGLLSENDYGINFIVHESFFLLY